MRIETPRIVQSRSKAIYLWALVPIIMLVGGLLGWQAVVDYRITFESDYQGLKSGYSLLQQKNIELERIRDRLREQVAALERAGQVDQEATRQVRDELKRKQDRWQEMEEELKFLRHIASNGKKSAALFIQGFRLRKGTANQEYIYNFTVSQGLKKSDHTKGWISLQVTGQQAGVKMTLALQDVTLAEQERIQMRFRHFQDVEGTFRLPKGFEPKSVRIEVEPASKKLSPIKKQFNWLTAD